MSKRQREESGETDRERETKPRINQPGFKRSGVARNRAKSQPNTNTNTTNTTTTNAVVKRVVDSEREESKIEQNVPKGCFTVFVGGLPYNASKQAVTQFFNRDGLHVWNVKIAAYQKQSNAQSAIQSSGVQNGQIDDQQSQNSEKSVDQSVSSKFANQQRGFAHVEFENEQQVNQAINQFHNQLWVDGVSRITVAIARPKQSNKQSTNQSNTDPVT